MIYQWFKQKSDRKAIADILYQVALAQSRRLEFYEQLGIADTVDGRFDLLLLHVFLIIGRLGEFGKEGVKQGQSLFDSMFRRMELDLREMGVGDLGVPKHMARMMKAFNGRAHVYQASLTTMDVAGLEEAIARNIYRGQLQGDVAANISAMADYTFRLNAVLRETDFDSLKGGNIAFPLIVSQNNVEKRSA